MTCQQTVNATQIGLHSMKNLLGHEEQLTLFREHKAKAFAEEYGITVDREISKYGIDLTDGQQRIVEGILHGFTRTKYKGNVTADDRQDHGKRKYTSGKLPPSYKYVQKLPRLRATQAEILGWAGVNRKSIGDIQDALSALKHLGTYQYCFYYTRLSFNERGEPQKDRHGDWIKEEVMGVDTLFTVTEVKDEKTKILKFYEITPSSLFMDQRESYFMLIPYNWREEVRKIVGQKKASSYTFRFLLFLRYQFELKRRSSKEKKPYIIKWSPEEVGIAIKMPESIYRKHKKKANKILEDVYVVAKQLGYLIDFQRVNGLDILYLNEEKYYSPRRQELLLSTEERLSPEMEQAKELLDFFTQTKKIILPKYNPSAGGFVRQASLRYLARLISANSMEYVKKIIAWGLTRPYWCNRIGTPSKLYRFFNEACAEMNAAKNSQETLKEYAQTNKNMAISFLKNRPQENVSTTIEILSQYVEIGNGIHQPTCIKYTEKGFEEQFRNALHKWRII